jgi:hypothetical protein
MKQVAGEGAAGCAELNTSGQSQRRAKSCNWVVVVVVVVVVAVATNGVV